MDEGGEALRFFPNPNVGVPSSSARYVISPASSVPRAPTWRASMASSRPSAVRSRDSPLAPSPIPTWASYLAADETCLLAALECPEGSVVLSFVDASVG